ncbi:MAG: hypothetical protein P1V51_09310 [Deltaproteobacteria bacterium]|nr:hypothetical protein [Deltaproteobacteria bacterium]
MRTTLLLSLTGCPEDPPPGESCGTPLFGRPAANTDLGPELCSAACACQAALFTAGTPDGVTIDALAATTLLDAPAVPEQDPYAAGTAPASLGDLVCAVLPEIGQPGTYRVRSLPLGLAGTALVTHHDACGLCSSLQDLSVYMRYPDLTEPVRECGLRSMTGTDEEAIACLEALGFTRPCARIWFFNTRNTRRECLGECLLALDEPYHLPDGSLNDGLLCDEEKSGPVFKAVAGRTRRNTGLASALCRPCAEVRPLAHDYSAVIGER